MTENKLIGFVILHYNTIRETRNCVSSILALEHANNSRIVIVDNASPNQTGKILSEDYCRNQNVEVILILLSYTLLQMQHMGTEI